MAQRMTMEGWADAYDPRFREIIDTSEVGEDMIPKFCTVSTPKLPTEKGSSLAGMGLWDEFAGTATYDSPTLGYNWSSTYKEYAKGTQIERSLIEYDLFNVADARIQHLKDSLHNTRQIECAQFFIQSFVVDSGYTVSEGVALCSDNHTSPVAGVSTTSGFDNLTTEAFSPAALKRIFIQGRKLKQVHGQPYDNNVFNTVIGPVDLIDRADEIFGTLNGLDTAEHNKNVLSGRYTYIPWVRLTDTNDYWVVDLAELKKNFIWFDKVKAEYARVDDLDTLVAKYRGYAIWHRARKTAWNYIVGSQVS